MHRHSGLLPWIIAFKAFKAIALTALGVAFVATRGSDPALVLMSVADDLHVPLTSRLFQRLLQSAGSLTVQKETALALTAFGYAALTGTEGVALYLRKPWAPWFIIIAISSLIPVEIYEIVRKLDAIRVSALIANVGIVAYLWQRKGMFKSGVRPEYKTRT